MNGNFSKLTRDNEARNYFSKLEFILKCKAQLEWSRFFKLFNRFTVIVLTQQVEVSRRKMYQQLDTSLSWMEVRGRFFTAALEILAPSST